MLLADRFSDGKGGSVDSGQALRHSIRAVLQRGPLIVSETEPTTAEPNGTYPASVISR